MPLLFIELISSKHTDRAQFSLCLSLSLFPSLASLSFDVARHRRAREAATCARSSNNATGSYDEIAPRAICRSERYNARFYSPGRIGRPNARTLRCARVIPLNNVAGVRYDMIDETYLTAEGLGSREVHAAKENTVRNERESKRAWGDVSSLATRSSLSLSVFGKIRRKNPSVWIEKKQRTKKVTTISWNCRH